MKIYIVKRKGASTFGNLCSFMQSKRYNEEGLLQGAFFVRKKDAKLFLKCNTNYPQFYEIVALELPKTNQDNRFNNGNKN